MKTKKVEIGTKKLKWWNLRQNKCPRCSKDFFSSAKTEIGKDEIHCECGFFISLEKYQKIVNDLNAKDVQEKLDQMDRERAGWLR